MNKISYGSFDNDKKLQQKKVSASSKLANKYGSDSLLNNYETTQSLINNESTSSIDNEFEQHNDVLRSTELVLSKALFNCSYIIEPVAFITNLASSIMGFSLGQFIYNRILNRLLKQASYNQTVSRYEGFYSKYDNVSNVTTLSTPSVLTTTSGSYVPGNSCNNQSHVNFSTIIFPNELSNFISLTNSFVNYQPIELVQHNLYHFSNSIDPSDLQKLIIKAQQETSNLYFMSALFAAIPVFLMTNILSTNCSKLGRKPLMLIYLFAITIRYFLILFQCIYPEWPDWLFYIGALIDGLSGGNGVFYLALYCFISDLTSPKHRSYRITFLNNLNSIASLCVTFMCGYVIKYYGYFYLFLMSFILMLSALFYTIFLIPEPLVSLENKSYIDRIKSCSLKHITNCLKVYYSNSSERNNGNGDAELTDDNNESQHLLNANQATTSRPKKQTLVLLSIVFANFVYNFGTLGISSIFTLFIMNKPYCFDSVDISRYSIFSTVISLTMSLFVSRFIKVNDLLICILSMASYFVSVFFYVYGATPYHLYIAASISSISGLEYAYARSIVSKSMDKTEVSDALSLILIIDTFIAVVSFIIFPIWYSKTVDQGINILFYFSNIIVFIAIVIHVVNYFSYKPIKPEEENLRPSDQNDVSVSREENMVNNNKHQRSNKTKARRSMSETNISTLNPDLNDDVMFRIPSFNSITGASNRNAVTGNDSALIHQSLMLSSVEIK